MIKKLHILLGVIALLLSWTASSAAEYTYPTIVLDGRQLPIAVPAIDEYGRTLVPVKAFFEEAGAVVNWDEAIQTVTISRADKEIKLTVGQNTAYVNEKPIDLETPPRILDGRVLVPVRFVAEAIGAEVTWSAEKHQIVINTTPPSSTGQIHPAIPGSNPDPGSIAGGPDTTGPTSPLSSDGKQLIMNSQILKILILLLIIVGGVGGALFLKRSRKKAAHIQIETPAAADLEEANQPTDNNEVVVCGEDGHQTKDQDGIDRSEANFLEATLDTAATVDVSYAEDIVNSADQAGADHKPKPQDNNETVEAYYNKGINMIQQQNWADARLALVFPSVVKYRDSVELGYYIEAQEQYEESNKPDAADPYWAAVMADFCCRKIPDDYDGMFKEEISDLKIMCKDHLAVFMQDLEI